MEKYDELDLELYKQDKLWITTTNFIYPPKGSSFQPTCATRIHIGPHNVQTCNNTITKATKFKGTCCHSRFNPKTHLHITLINPYEFNPDQTCFIPLLCNTNWRLSFGYHNMHNLHPFSIIINHNWSLKIISKWERPCLYVTLRQQCQSSKMPTARIKFDGVFHSDILSGAFQITILQ